jgi:glycosyltransferase involved in cell wall biosynthesis
MSLGKPVVSTAAGGPLEIVKTGETGLLVPPGDPAAMADAINTMLRDPGLRRSCGANGLLRFQRQFTARAMAHATLRVYERALDTPKTVLPKA